MTLDEWFDTAATDADRRNLPDLKPVLKGLHGAADALRAAVWNDDARISTGGSTPDLTPAAPSSRASS